MMIDLRSDTVTRPTPAMRRAMAEAEVGDDVIDVDPTLDLLEKETAEFLGKEAAIFMPSGSMTNQIAIRLHCGRGDEFICEADCHVYNYEQAAFAQLSGVVAKTVVGQAGVMRLEQLRGLIRPENDHMVRTRLVCIENTHNRGAGRVQPFAEVRDICHWAHGQGLKTHLDGARLWNAAVASGISERQWASLFDSVSVCFSKGLGAPVGSCLVGTREFVREARRARKLFGGGMRQAGIIAAGALYALRHHRDRLHEDHEHARMLGEAITEAPGLSLAVPEVESNIVIFNVAPLLGTAAQFAQKLAQKGLHVLVVGPQAIRIVTHLDVGREAIEQACGLLKSTANAASHPMESEVPAATR